MKYFYGEYDGQEFPTPDQLFNVNQLMQLILQYGEQALKAIEQMLRDGKDPEQSELLEQMIKDGTFREDLFFRLNVVPATMPPLRERGEDILLLAAYFIKKYDSVWIESGRATADAGLCLAWKCA